jgi:hypothetical protein
VGVVHRQQQRAAVREIHGQPVQAVEGAEDSVGILGDRAGPVVTEEPPRQLGGAREQRVRFALGRSAHRPLVQLARHAEGKLALAQGPACSADPQPGLLGQRGGAGQQPALAEPRRRLHQKRASRALACPRDGFGERLQLGLALKQVGAQHAHGHRIAIGLRGDPVPPRMRSGAATNRNSQRPASSQAPASARRWR